MVTITGIVKNVINNEHTSGKQLLVSYFIINNSANYFTVLIFFYFVSQCFYTKLYLNQRSHLDINILIKLLYL